MTPDHYPVVVGNRWNGTRLNYHPAIVQLVGGIERLVVEVEQVEHRLRPLLSAPQIGPCGVPTEVVVVPQVDNGEGTRSLVVNLERTRSEEARYRVDRTDNNGTVDAVGKHTIGTRTGQSGLDALQCALLWRSPEHSGVFCFNAGQVTGHNVLCLYNGDVEMARAGCPQ